MERAVVLDRLRKSGTFPKNFEDPKYESQRAVIRWLLKRKPDQRYVCIQKGDAISNTTIQTYGI
jgi:hypothetical protein